jgi:hypothetical protein
MPYILAIVIVAIAVVLGIFTGVWGGLVWIVVAGIALAVLLAFRARENTVQSSSIQPTGTPRGGTADAGTANQRVGQS